MLDVAQRDLRYSVDAILRLMDIAPIHCDLMSRYVVDRHWAFLVVNGVLHHCVYIASYSLSLAFAWGQAEELLVVV